MIFDLLISEVDGFIPYPVGHVCKFVLKSVYSFSKYRVRSVRNGRTDKQRTGRKHYVPGLSTLAEALKIVR